MSCRLQCCWWHRPVGAHMAVIITTKCQPCRVQPRRTRFLSSSTSHHLQPSAPPRPTLMSAASVVFISGATGVHAAGINGPYDGTSQSSNGYTLFRKRGDTSVLMEHFEGRWNAKAVSEQGKSISFASVAGYCALEACTTRQWSVWDGKRWFDAPGVKMVTGAEAERQVSGCGLRALEHAPLPPLAAARCLMWCVLRRALSMPPPRRGRLPPTMHELCPCSSAAPQASVLPPSTGFSNRRRFAGEGAGRPCASLQARRCRHVDGALWRAAADQICDRQRQV